MSFLDQFELSIFKLNVVRMNFILNAPAHDGTFNNATCRNMPGHIPPHFYVVVLVQGMTTIVK
jgi:hypothetical protein